MADERPLHHVAIIPDGNRRWALSHHLPSFLGHQQGAQTLKKILKKLYQLHVHTVTIWGFSTENWQRSDEEVRGLMDLFCIFLDELIHTMQKYKTRVYHIGRTSQLPTRVLEKLQSVEKITEQYSDHVLNICIDYGGRDEIVRAIQKGIEQGVHFTQDSLSTLMDTGEQRYPDPDLIIRTSGEKRLSGFMPWQSIYAELIFLDKFFPDVNEDDMDHAVKEYYARQRRFGK